MKITVADQADLVLIQSPRRDDCALVLTRRCLASSTAALGAACSVVPAPVLGSQAIERAASNGTQSAQGETCTDAPSQQHRTRLRGHQSHGNAAELAQLASQIRESHERYVSSVRTNLEHAMEVGGLLLQAKLQPAGVLTLKAVLKQIAQDGRRNAPAQAASPEPADAQQAAEGPVAGSEASVAIGVPAGSEIPAPAGPVEMTPPSHPEPSVDGGQGPAGEGPDPRTQVAELAPGPAQK